MKKLLAVLLAVTMLFTAAIIPAHANGVDVEVDVSNQLDKSEEVTTFDELNAALVAGKNVKLGADITYSGIYNDMKFVLVPAGVDVIIDLNGYTLAQITNKNGGLSLAAIVVRAGAQLTIRDEVGTGKISACSTAFQLEGKLNLESGRIVIGEVASNADKDPESGFAYGVWMYIREGATIYPEFNMTGGSIEMVDNDYCKEYISAVASGDDANGGVTSAYANTIVNITGGTFQGNVVVSDMATVNVPEGTDVVRMHKLTYHDATDPTCTEKGWEAYESCSQCDYTTYKEIPATGNHTGGTATCTNKAVCTVCKQSYGALKSHSYTKQVATSKYLKSAATCTKSAVYYKSCSCGAKGTATFTSGSAKGHSYTKSVVSSKYLKSAATCTKSAVYYKSCSCGAKGTATFTSGSAKGHSYTKSVVSSKYLKSAATCTKAAVYYKSCSCGAKGTATFTYGSAKGHKYTKVTTKAATTSSNGYILTECSVCGVDKSKTTIYAAKTVKLSTTSYTYTGSAKKPSVTVKDSKGKTISSKYYTVKYESDRKYVGKYKVTIKFKGNYSRTKILYFTINPPKTTVSKLTAGKKSIKVYVGKKTSQVTGYQIQYSTSKKFTSPKTKTITKYSTTSTTLTKLTSKKTYYVRVRTYKTVSGKKYYSGWSTYESKKAK